MSRFFVVSFYILLVSYLINFASRAGWDYDPGIVGPAMIVIAINLTLAIWNE